MRLMTQQTAMDKQPVPKLWQQGFAKWQAAAWPGQVINCKLLLQNLEKMIKSLILVLPYLEVYTVRMYVLFRPHAVLA